MGVWTGWQPDLLGRAGLPTDEGHGNFLFDWHSHAASDCKNNPIDISRAAGGASDCHKLTATRTAKNYGSQASAATAFSTQIHSGTFPALLRALNSAIPYQQPSPKAVAADLRKWGSPAFATYYLAHSNTGSGGGQGSGGSAEQPHVHKGWHDVRRSVNSRLPHALRQINSLTRQTLRATSKGAKVRH